jgi:hypothetical protein
LECARPPNTLVGLALLISGIVAVVMLGTVIVAMLFTDPSSDSPFTGLCWIFILILIIIAFIILLVGVIVVGILAMGFVAQVIAGALALKGKRFGWTLALSIIGTVASFLAPCVISVAFLITDQKYPLMCLPGLLEAVIAIVSLIATIMVGLSKSSFEPPKPKSASSPKGKNIAAAPKPQKPDPKPVKKK